jgi:hypothetical protein
VSCSGATTCTAVGGDNDNQAIDATGSSGSWGPATEVTTPGGGGDFYACGLQRGHDLHRRGRRQ